VHSDYPCCRVRSHTLETINYDFRQVTAPIDADAEEYNMEHEKRGRAIIFNHEKYEKYLYLDDRTGTDIDKQCLKECFEKLKFDVEVYDDFSREDIKKKLLESKY
jgi:hypothetical protein